MIWVFFGRRGPFEQEFGPAALCDLVPAPDGAFPLQQGDLSGGMHRKRDTEPDERCFPQSADLYVGDAI
jgi:hypothetical protein